MIGAVRELAVHWRADRGSASVNGGGCFRLHGVALAEFEESTVETVYQFVFDGRRAPKTSRRVFYDMLPSSNGVLLFGVEERNCAEIEQELGEVHYFSPFSGLLQWMAGRKQTARQRRILYTAGRRKLTWPISRDTAYLPSTRSTCKRPTTFLLHLPVGATV